MNPREIALEIIYKTINDAAYTNLLMRDRLNVLPINQRPFVTNLVNSVLKKYYYLLFQIQDEINDSTPLRNKIILAMALYEKFYLKEKDYVVNNEYVNLAKNKYGKAFINAILRKDIKLKNSDEEHINYSLPLWLYKLLNKQYSKEDFLKIMDNYSRIPKVYYRLNHQKAKLEDFKDIEIINEDIFINNNKNLLFDDINNGLVYIQDINSASLYKKLALKEDDSLLDVCGAPGSKFFNCLDIVKPSNAYVNELHEKRLKLISNKAEILGFKGANYLNYDGRLLKDVLDIKFDKIMLDVPCSGLGTIGRRPDLKYHLAPNNLDELEIIQKELLDSVVPLLKESGYILYSTCTLNKKENEKQINRFLNENNNFSLIDSDTIINDLGDCFYYALLLKGYNK